MNPQEKAKVLSKSFISSLLSYNPVKSLRETSEMYRSNQGLDLIAKNLALTNEISIYEASVFVKDAIRNSALIHRMNN